jgi:hypothetical protein
MRAVLWAAVFFEASSDDECDPDVAVKQLEQIAFELRQLSREEQLAFRDFARREAQRDPSSEVRTLIGGVVDGLLPDHQPS